MVQAVMNHFSEAATVWYVFLQMLLVVWTWLIAVPLGTCWMWRLSFVASLEGAVAMLASRMHPVYFVADCLQVQLFASPSILLVRDVTIVKTNSQNKRNAFDQKDQDSYQKDLNTDVLQNSAVLA